jgi:hypothetical protein
MWTAALRDAAGLLAAYITPAEYGLSAFSGEMAIGTDPFERELRKRLDLGRVVRFAEIVAILRVEPDRLRRKSVRYTTGEILGTIHIPKYVASLAAGMPDRIPVLQSRYNKRTPENQLIAEGLERSLAVCRSWMAKGGAEGNLAAETHRQLSAASRAEPWRDLIRQPRPPLKPLAAQVRNLVASGVIPSQPYNEMSLLLGGLSQASGEMAFIASAGLLSLLVTSDAKFEDKLFELLCLSWFIKALSKKADKSTLELFSGRLKAAKGNPVASARINGKTFSLFFQSGVVLPFRNWSYVSTGKKLEAIFDIFCRVTSANGADTIDIIIDAKNRSAASEGEVAYKMLGYKENVLTEHQRFIGLAIFLSEEPRLKVKSLHRGEHRLWLAYAPLGKSEQTVRFLGTLLGNHRLGVF